MFRAGCGKFITFRDSLLTRVESARLRERGLEVFEVHVFRLLDL